LRISYEQIRHVAALARLRFSEGELEAFRSQFERIVEYVEKIDELDLDGVEPTSHAMERSNVLREDETAPSLTRELALANAPREKNGFVVVPKVIEEP